MRPKNSGDDYGDIAVRASGYERHTDDWYVEPAWCVDALIQVERPFIGEVLDPCCGGGNIGKCLTRAGVYTVNTDIVDRGGGPVDIVADYHDAIGIVGPKSIVSNPPYGDAQDFVETALAGTRDRVCVLLRLAFLEGQKRREWFKSVPLARVWVSSKRISMPPGGSHVPAKGGSIAYAWFVFEHGYRGLPVIGWLPDIGKNQEESTNNTTPEEYPTGRNPANMTKAAGSGEPGGLLTTIL
ncbi:hypothetical protein [Acetobacter pasteurianus]|uniref:hypothetical protein n=1 Tax=Acetobacter pasteurianus TaxID=438 RepID=UPI003D09C7D2